MIRKILCNKFNHLRLRVSKSTIVNKNGFTPSANGGCQKSTAVKEYGFTPFANGGCQSLLNGFTPFANGGCQSLLQSTRRHCYFCWINMYCLSSMNEFLKMFWLFECWLSIYLLMPNECLFSWYFNMNSLFHQKYRSEQSNCNIIFSICSY